MTATILVCIVVLAALWAGGRFIVRWVDSAFRKIWG